MYQPKRHARSEFVPIRDQNYHVWTWGTPTLATPPLVLVHGWMDIGASFQFMVDALCDAFAEGRFIVAPDWRGYGLTTGPDTDTFWFPDYVADLDFLVRHYAQDRPIDLVGHSLGGNVVMHYAGARPGRIRRLVNLEGFAGPVRQVDDAPRRLGKWMDQLHEYREGDIELRSYSGVEGVARRLAKTNPRLARDDAGRHKAEWLAGHWAKENDEGRWEILGHPAHKLVNPYLTNVPEILAMYRAITAPLLAVEASDDSLAGWYAANFTLADYHERLQQVRDHRVAVVQDAGHMLHHDQPEQLARLLEDFLG